MKKLKYILLLSLSCIVISCDIDLEPENALTYSNSFNTEEELNATTTSIHYFMNTSVRDNYLLTNAGVIADVAYSKKLRNWDPYGVFSSFYGDWKGIYDMIFESHLLLDNINRTEKLSKQRYNYHVGQARFALGLGYFVLSQRYGQCVILNNSKDIIEYGLSPLDKVLEEAIKHAEKGYEILPKYSSGNKQFATKGSCAALLAHLYAWKGSMIDLYEIPGEAKEAYKKSIEYSSKIINDEVGNYSLCSSPEELCEYLSDPSKNNPEAIFSLVFDKAASNYSVTPNTVASNYASWPVKTTDALDDIVYNTNYRIFKGTIDNLYSDPQDLRRNAYFFEINKPHVVDDYYLLGAKDYAILNKHRKAVYTPNEYSPSGLSYRSLDCDFTYWRLADIILLRAECNVKINKDALAITDLNTIRTRAGAAQYPSSYDTEGLQKAIFREREKEFLAENDGRYFDVIRNKYYATELQGKFNLLTNEEIKYGALFLPIPSTAIYNSDGQKINTKIKRKPYWAAYK